MCCGLYPLVLLQVEQLSAEREQLCSSVQGQAAQLEALQAQVAQLQQQRDQALEGSRQAGSDLDAALSSSHKMIKQVRCSARHGCITCTGARGQGPTWLASSRCICTSSVMFMCTEAAVAAMMQHAGHCPEHAMRQIPVLSRRCRGLGHISGELPVCLQVRGITFALDKHAGTLQRLPDVTLLLHNLKDWVAGSSVAWEDMAAGRRVGSAEGQAGDGAAQCS